MNIVFTKNSLFSFHWSFFHWHSKRGNKNPLHCWCRQTIVRMGSWYRQ